MTTRMLAVITALGAGATLALTGAIGIPGPPQQGLGDLPTGEIARVGPDRVAAGMEVVLRDSVPGDAMATGGEVTVEAPVAGDVLGAGGRVEIAGRVGGSVRAAGGWVELRAPVARNVTLAGGQVTIGEGAEVGGNAYLAGGSVDVLRPVRGHLLVGGGEVRIDAPVEGSVDVAAERLTLGPDARVQGDLVYRSPNVVDRAAEAVVAGSVTREPVEEPSVPGWLPWATDWVGKLFSLAGFLFTGLVLGAIFPGTADRLLRSGREKPLPSLGIGLVALFVVPAVLLASLITVVGIPLALVGGALFGFAVYLARAVLALWIGDALLGDRAGSGRRRVLLGFLVGGALLFVVGLVPWLGPTVKVLATAFGLGAAGVALREARGAGVPAETPGGGPG